MMQLIKNIVYTTLVYIKLLVRINLVVIIKACKIYVIFISVALTFSLCIYFLVRYRFISIISTIFNYFFT